MGVRKSRKYQIYEEAKLKVMRSDMNMTPFADLAARRCLSLPRSKTLLNTEGPRDEACSVPTCMGPDNHLLAV